MYFNGDFHCNLTMKSIEKNCKKYMKITVLKSSSLFFLDIISKMFLIEYPRGPWVFKKKIRSVIFESLRLKTKKSRPFEDHISQIFSDISEIQKYFFKKWKNKITTIIIAIVIVW